MIIKNLRAILKEDDEATPCERDLRKVVRAALRHVRRERSSVWIRDLLEPTEDGKEFLANFCIRRLRNLQCQRRGAMLDQGINFDDPAIFAKLPPEVRQSLGLGPCSGSQS